MYPIYQIWKKYVCYTNCVDPLKRRLKLVFASATAKTWTHNGFLIVLQISRSYSRKIMFVQILKGYVLFKIIINRGNTKSTST